jgi:acyl phosphate:glycerol-3-phosphate acyltransferase
MSSSLWSQGWLWIAAAYLLGSVPFAVLVSRALGLRDPREYGSKNPGATNVLRSGNKFAAALTLLLDGAKGWLAVWVAQRSEWQWQLSEGTIAAVALAVVAGHIFPIFLRLRGGKGVATTLGVMLGIAAGFGLITCMVWLAVAVLLGYSSLAAIIAVIFAAVAYPIWFGGDTMTLSLCAICLLVLWRHRRNLSNLVSGREPRIALMRSKTPVAENHHGKTPPHH